MKHFVREIENASFHRWEISSHGHYGVVRRRRETERTLGDFFLAHNSLLSMKTCCSLFGRKLRSASFRCKATLRGKLREQCIDDLVRLLNEFSNFSNNFQSFSLSSDSSSVLNSCRMTKLQKHESQIHKAIKLKSFHTLQTRNARGKREKIRGWSGDDRRVLFFYFLQDVSSPEKSLSWCRRVMWVNSCFGV